MILTLVVITAVSFLGYSLLRYIVDGKSCKSQARLDGKTVIVTGGNTGIGKETARDMARRGARVILACRNTTKADTAAADIRETTGSSKVVVQKLDLASLASVREFAKVFLERENRLDILINNAGIMMCPRWETEDGFEMQMGTNHFGHFLLTNLLLDLLKKSASSRIVNTSSIGHHFAISGINFDDIHYKKSYEPTIAYGRSKLANILFTRELAVRLKGTGVTAYAVHPGAVQTELLRYTHLGYPFLKYVLQFISWTHSLWMRTPLQGAQTNIYCAVEEILGETTGKYYSNCAETKTSKAAQDDKARKRLWEVSTHLVGLDEFEKVD